MATASLKRRLAVPTAAIAIAAGTTMTVAATGHAAPAATAAPAALSSTWYASAPYLMPEDNSPPNVSTVMDATGVKAA